MFRELKTLMAIARHGTFAAAGSQVGLTQSAVSAQMRRLEQDFGAPLFTRHARSAEMNDAGRALVAVAEQMLQAYAQARGQFADLAPRRIVRLGAIPSAQTGILPEALAMLRSRAPGVHVNILTGSSAQLLDLLDVGKLDMAMVIRPPTALPRQVRWQLLLRERYVLIAPPGTARRSLAQLLQDSPFIRYDRLSYGGRPVEHFLQRHRLTVKDFAEFKELEAIVRMVECGLGVAIVPDARSLGLRTRGVVKVTLEDVFHRDIGLASRARTAPTPELRDLQDCLVAATSAARRSRQATHAS